MTGLLVAGLLVTGCASPVTEPVTPATRPAASPAPPSTSSEPGASGTAGSDDGSLPPGTPRPSAHGDALPAPDAAVPTGPERLARELVRTEAALGRAVDAWLGDDGKAEGEPPEPVVLLSLYQQRVYRLMGHRPELARRVVERLPSRLAARAADDAEAARSLFSLTRPTSTPGRFRTQDPPEAEKLRGHMREAERRFGVGWEVLAAVMLVETKFGRLRSPSSAGAQGPMQFMPATWKAYGLGGDVRDPRDAVLGAANYLRASGAPRDYRRALYAYNHDQRYVDAVQRYARTMRRDPRAYYTYYNWQVFVLTTRGDLRITGPRS
ncbi:transglycosylase SLT domain-containing protein [Sphaerisporangium sp. NPDC051011]|uniref:transglycosylase SLT domain-containing protein n=1 Tax=Sphaerisporangium sp. NPDC051011 TaxID=3155792 RepID=UPI0033EA5E49